MVDEAKRRAILAPLTNSEREEVERYIAIYVREGCTTLREVNRWIDQHVHWDEFPSIRSLNDHGYPTEVPGIDPSIYKIVCRILEIESDYGRPLLKSRRY